MAKITILLILTKNNENIFLVHPAPTVYVLQMKRTFLISTGKIADPRRAFAPASPGRAVARSENLGGT